MAIKIRDRVIKALGGLPLPNGPRPSATEIKTVGSGVQWVGSPDFRTIIRLDSQAFPEAEELTKNIALATSADLK